MNCKQLLSACLVSIVLMARIDAGRNWKSLSTPRGKSQEYNFNPQKSGNQHKVRDDGLEKYPL